MNLMYSMSVPVFAKTLGNLSAILDKAAAHAEAKKIDPAVLLAARLYPDMFPLTKQVQVACDFAKGTVARLAGEEPPKYDDNETTIEALKARIEKVTAPLLILHGTADNVVPHTMADELYQRAGSRDKRVVKLEGATHSGMRGSASAYREAVLSFTQASAATAASSAAAGAAAVAD